jgi:hypothetical protein
MTSGWTVNPENKTRITITNAMLAWAIVTTLTIVVRMPNSSPAERDVTNRSSMNMK